ncbi:MAG TPA: hemolysin III family protein [Alphaproteobacteria bacterium]
MTRDGGLRREPSGARPGHRLSSATTFPGERAADRFVHVLGVAASLAAAGALMIVAIANLETLPVLSLAVYATGLAAGFGLSAGYHLVTREALRKTLRRLDHAAIFVLIAGTYTPFALVSIGGPWGHALLAAVWAIALVGIAAKVLLPGRFERAAIVLYLVQGWAGLAVLNPLVNGVSATTLSLLGAGGVLYTLGVVFHLWRGLRYQTAIWHAFVLVAAACHYVAVLDAVALAGADR